MFWVYAPIWLRTPTCTLVPQSVLLHRKLKLIFTILTQKQLITQFGVWHKIQTSLWWAIFVRSIFPRGEYATKNKKNNLSLVISHSRTNSRLWSRRGLVTGNKSNVWNSRHATQLTNCYSSSCASRYVGLRLRHQLTKTQNNINRTRSVSKSLRCVCDMQWHRRGRKLNQIDSHFCRQVLVKPWPDGEMVTLGRQLRTSQRGNKIRWETSMLNTQIELQSPGSRVLSVVQTTGLFSDPEGRIKG